MKAVIIRYELANGLRADYTLHPTLASCIGLTIAMLGITLLQGKYIRIERVLRFKEDESGNS